PVLLMHPLALSSELWRPLAEGESGLRFIGLDAPGHGNTPWDGQPFTVEDMADDAVAVMDALDLPSAALVGLSMGGTTAAVLAGTRPERITSLALVDTTACYGDDRVTEWESRAVRASTVQRSEQLEFQIDRWFSPTTVGRDPASVDRVCRIFAATDSEAHAAACRALGGADATGLLPAITAPTLVLVGSDDYATPESMARELHAGIAGSRLEVLEGSRHLSVLDDASSWQLVTEHIRTTTGTAVRR
ncbi:MAG: alpha/beta fold hydrolase, partial [Nocardioidaceae bacterium]